MPPVRRAGRERFPTRVTPRPAAPWSKAPGPPALPPRAVDTGTCAAQPSPQFSKTSVGKPRSGGVHATADASHEANTPTWSRWPWPGSWPDACGPWPSRCRSHPQAQTHDDATGHGEGVHGASGSGAAPVWGHPRRREEACRRTREPRARQAPDGGTSGGHQPTERRRITRRI
jgi:hypothetical protein